MNVDIYVYRFINIYMDMGNVRKFYNIKQKKYIKFSNKIK